MTRSSVNVRNDWTGQVTGFNAQGVTYFQADLSSNGVCNAVGGAGCFNPDHLVVTTVLRTQNAGSQSPVAADRIFPFVRGRGANPPREFAGTTWVSIRSQIDETTLSSIDMGTFTEHTFTSRLRGEGWPAGDFVIRMLGMNNDGNGLSTVDNFVSVRTN